MPEESESGPLGDIPRGHAKQSTARVVYQFVDVLNEAISTLASCIPEFLLQHAARCTWNAEAD